MKKSLYLLFTVLLMSFYGCEKDNERGEGEGNLLEGLIRVEALLSIQDADFKQVHPMVPDKDVKDLLYITFDSRDGEMTIDDQTGNDLIVNIDYTSFFGTYHQGSMNLMINKSGDSHFIDFEGSKKEETSTVTEEYMWKVEGLSESNEVTITDVSTTRHLYFELNGKAVCEYLEASNIPNSSINPKHVWDSSLSFKQELVNCNCEGESRMLITLVFDAS